MTRTYTIPSCCSSLLICIYFFWCVLCCVVLMLCWSCVDVDVVLMLMFVDVVYIELYLSRVCVWEVVVFVIICFYARFRILWRSAVIPPFCCIQPVGTSGAKVFCLFFLFSFSVVSSPSGSNCPYLITQSRALSPEGKFFCHFIGFSWREPTPSHPVVRVYWFAFTFFDVCCVVLC